MDSVREDAPFAIRLVAGVDTRYPGRQPQTVVKILLDGQQRCSSLFYATFEPSVPLYGRKSSFKFVMDIKEALSANWEKSVVSYNTKNAKEVATYSTDNYIHFSEFLDQTKLISKLNGNLWSNRIPEIFSIVNRFCQFKVQMVELRQNTPLDTVIEIFERINRTGMPLNITDLLVARQFKSGNNLRGLIEASEQKYQFLQEENNIDPEFVLRAMCAIRGDEINKGNILKLPPQNFTKEWEYACSKLEEAYRFITNLQTGFGAIDIRRFMPFKTMIIPLAGLLHHVSPKGHLSLKSQYEKISEWYWASVFANRYNEAVNTTTSSDVQRVAAWMEDDAKIPEFIKNFNVLAIDFYVSSKASATYRGVLCCILKEGALDFKSGKDPVQEIQKLQDDHIFPRVGYSDNSIINRTLISTNAEKSNQQPGKYFSALETVHGRDELLSILQTHLIDKHCLRCLLSNDLDGFKRARLQVFRGAVKMLVPHALNPQPHES